MNPENRVTIAVDAEGGDHAPKEIIRGSLQAVRKTGDSLILVGHEKKIEKYLKRIGGSESSVRVVHAPERIEMGDHPAAAIRRKPNSSIVVAAKLVRDGEADAFFSAGSTGASVCVASLILGRAPGIDRPAIATIMPTIGGHVVLLDAGANVDCTVENLLQFAVMGSVYARDVLGVANPRVGLLSIGEEPTKGNEVVKQTHRLLAEGNLNFIGNIEGRPLFAGEADVVVCDGFMGNVVLKVAEGVVDLLKLGVKEKLVSKPFYWPMLLGLAPGLMRLHKELDWTEQAGAPLLGVNGICIIGHGSSKAKAIRSAVRIAGKAARNDIQKKISLSLEDSTPNQVIQMAENAQTASHNV
mgnify:CR=1 FL=1